MERALSQPPGSVLLVATDGETFGHHKKAGAAELARALAILDEREELEITNCAPRAWTSGLEAGTFEINAASAWSCQHGVERWRSDCGCRLTGDTSQHWRQPLREAVALVKRARRYAVCERWPPKWSADPRQALKESIALAIDPNPATTEGFFTRRGLDR